MRKGHAQASLDRAADEKAQAEAEKAQLRAQLLLQFNAILQTRDTARGLIVNMSDVLFDTAKFRCGRRRVRSWRGWRASLPAIRDCSCRWRVIPTAWAATTTISSSPNIALRRSATT